MNIPNTLTILRLILLPVMIWAVMAGYSWLALGLYVFGAVTDFLDGYLARKLNQVSAFGTFLDPIADKVYVMAVLVTLVANGAIAGVWIIAVIIILAREFLVAGLREYLGPKNVKLPVSQLAKGKTALQMIALGVLIAPLILPFQTLIGLILIAGAAIVTVITGIQYMRKGLAHMGDLS